MIKSKKELAYYLECDRVALGKKQKRPSFFGDEIWKFQICMRKLDFYSHASEGGGTLLQGCTAVSDITGCP